MSSGPINCAIKNYLTLGRRRFHLPGHSGVSLFQSVGLNASIYPADLTELEGLDVLSEPSGCIADSQAQVAAIYNVAHSFYLVNGATVGLQAAMLACFQPGDSVLVPRNAHRSVLAGLILADLTPVWFLPQSHDDFGLWGAVTVEQVVTHYHANPNLKGVVVTSPTYEGIGSDMVAIGQFCRANGLKLIVDEAHGSLWSFSEVLPASACQAPVDVVAQSLHKGVGSLTQTAVTHLPHGSTVSPTVYQQALNTLQTTSPSYILLANAESAILHLNSDAGRSRLAAVLAQSQQLRDMIHSSDLCFELFNSDSLFWDASQLFLKCPFQPGDEWAITLEETYRMSFESVQKFGALYKVGLGLKPEDFEVFFEALAQLTNDICPKNLAPYDFPCYSSHYLPFASMTIMSPRSAFFAPGLSISKSQSIGRIAKETVVHCPPGIPVLYPGEKIVDAVLPYLPETIMVVA